MIGSCVVRVFDYNAAATGLNEAQIKALGMVCEAICVIPGDRVYQLPEAEPVHFKLLYEVPTGKILGAQAIGKGNVDKRVDVVATALKLGAGINALKDLELCYAPLFGTAKDVVNHAAYVGTNLLNGAFRQTPVTKVRELTRQGAVIIDVREDDEYAQGHIAGASNLPLSRIRDQLEKIPKDRNIYLYCRMGQRSYFAATALQHLGFSRVSSYQVDSWRYRFTSTSRIRPLTEKPS